MENTAGAPVKGGARIKKVDLDSIGKEVGLEKGDILLEINGEQIRDIVDYRWFAAEEDLVLKVLKGAGGRIWEIEIEKDWNESLGLEFDPPTIREVRECSNNCVFCFVDQNPPGMRETVYFKDDDFLLSFLEGHYISLASLSEEEMERIVKEGISPLYVSVHATDPVLRRRMMRNRVAGGIMTRLRHLADHGIFFHCQVVLCPGWNDGEQLERTLKELVELGSGVESVAVVPVGLTSHRSNLVPLQPVKKEGAASALDTVHSFQEELLTRRGSRVIFGADELYLKAGYSIPSEEEYENYPQLSNGVGLIRLFREDCRISKLFAGGAPGFNRPLKITLVTGKAAYGVLKEAASLLEDSAENLEVNVEPVDNLFFGEEVTVAGLLTGTDLEEGLYGKAPGEAVIFPRVMLGEFKESFLDNRTPEEVQSALGVPLYPAEDLEEIEDIVRELLSGE